MAAKDWECATPGCGHLQYEHRNQGIRAVASGCTHLTGKEKNKKVLCPCTGYKPPKGKVWA